MTSTERTTLAGRQSNTSSLAIKEWPAEHLSLDNLLADTGKRKKTSDQGEVLLRREGESVLVEWEKNYLPGTEEMSLVEWERNCNAVCKRVLGSYTRYCRSRWKQNAIKWVKSQFTMGFLFLFQPGVFSVTGSPWSRSTESLCAEMRNPSIFSVFLAALALTGSVPFCDGALVEQSQTAPAGKNNSVN